MAVSLFPGKHTQALRLTTRNITNCHIKAIPVSKITNGLVVELIRFQKSRKQPLRMILKWLELLFGKHWPENVPAELTLLKSLSVLYQKHRKLVISRNLEKLNSFCLSPYCIPKTKQPKAPHISDRVRYSSKRHSLLRRQEHQAYRRTIRDLADELHSALHNAELLRSAAKRLGHTNVRNIRKRERRKNAIISTQKKHITRLSAENKVLRTTARKHSQQHDRQIKALKDELIHQKSTTQKKVNKYKSRSQRLKLKNKMRSIADESPTSDDEIPEDMAIRVKELEVQVDELSEALEELRSCKMQTMDTGHYHHKVRECCMKLMSHNVSIRNVDACIRAVVDLLGQDICQLPKKSTLANMMVEARSVAHLQLAEELSKPSSNTLHSDGTTKFGEKFGGFQVTTQESSYTLCLTEMKAGGAKDFKHILERSLSDIEAAYRAVNQPNDQNNSKAKQILASIKNTMSDRHVVEKNFNQLLEEYRDQVLPDVIQGWTELTPDQQASISKMNNFFCGLHFLVALADAASATLQQWESMQSAVPDGSSSECGTMRLVRTACKAIQKQCCQKAGCHTMFKAYLKTQGVTIFPVAKFAGNRFNIIFHNAAGIYYLRKHLIRYLDNLHPSRNMLLQAVLRDLKHPLYLTGCCALGIISKCLTSPLWRILESPLSMSELGQEYQRMYRSLLKWSQDATDLLTGHGLDQLHGDDNVFQELISGEDDKSQVLELLQMLCKSFSQVSERLLGDHLEGGLFSSTCTKDLDEVTATVPKTNARSERDFAILDRYVSMYALSQKSEKYLIHFFLFHIP